jgi:hypothetical protein
MSTAYVYANNAGQVSHVVTCEREDRHRLAEVLEDLLQTVARRYARGGPAEAVDRLGFHLVGPTQAEIVEHLRRNGFAVDVPKAD